MALFWVLLRKTGCGGNVAVPPDNSAGSPDTVFTYWMIVPAGLIEESIKPPLYALGLQAGGLQPGMTTWAITIAYPTGTLVRGVLSLTVTRLPASLMAVMLEV